MKKRRNHRAKRAEIASQLFIYMLGIIVIGLLLLLGYRAIDKLQEKRCTVLDTSFQTDLSAAIEKNKGRGISRIESFTPPCDVERVCFVSRTITDALPGDPAATSPLSAFAGQYPTIVDSVESGDDTNVFVRGDEGYEPLELFSKAAPIELPADEPIRCISGDPLRIRFNGKGKAVEPSAP